MRMPRSDAAQRLAMAADVCAPSSIAVNRSSSSALLSAADCSYANNVSKIAAGSGMVCVDMASFAERGAGYNGDSRSTMAFA